MNLSRKCTCDITSVQFSHSVVSDSLQPHEPQHARPPCPSPTAGVYPNPCPSSRWCHPNISSSVIPFSCPQSFPASGSFQVSQLFTSGGQSIGVSASTLGFHNLTSAMFCSWYNLTEYILTPWTVAPQAPVSMGFSRQEYWTELPCSSPGNLPNPRIEPGSPTSQADSLPSEPPGKPILTILIFNAQWRILCIYKEWREIKRGKSGRVGDEGIFAVCFWICFMAEFLFTGGFSSNYE